MACPTLDELLDLLQGELSEDKRGAVQRHVEAGCVRCHREMSRLRDLLEVVTNPCLLDPPEWLFRHAVVLFRQRLKDPSPSRISRILAFLVIDNFAESRLLGLRHIDPSSRQMLYRAGAYEIDLLIERSETTPGVDLLGQVRPCGEGIPPFGEAIVELWRDDQLVGTAKINPMGDFVLEGIPEGIYDVRLQREGDEIHITGLQALLQTEEGLP